MPLTLESQPRVADNVKTRHKPADKAFTLIRWYWLLFFLLVSALLTLIIVKTYPASTIGLPPTILDAARFPSGGIGLTKAEWEKTHVLKVNKESAPNIYDPHYYDYDGKPFGEYVVNFWPDPQRDRGSLIIRGITGNPTKILSDVLDIRITPEQLDQEKEQQAARALLPNDAELVESGRLPTHQHELIETYHSKLLEERYPSLPGVSKPWGENRPGTIHVSYSIYSEVLVHANLVVPPAPEPTTPTLVDTPPPLPTALPTRVIWSIPTPLGTRSMLPLPVPSRSIPIQ